VYVDALWAAVGGGNFRMILMPSERWGGPYVVSPVVHFWSLAVEEQFYLVWPVVMLLAWAIGRRRGVPRRWTLGAALTATCTSLALGVWGALVDPAAAYFSSAARGWELGVGVALAILVPHLERMTPLARSVLAFGGLAALELAAVAWMQQAYPAPAGLVPVLGTAALIAAGTGGTSLVTRVLGTRALGRIGDLSYSLYLWHFPVFVFMVVLQPSGGWDVLAESFVLLVLLAWLSYRFVERPVLRWFRQRSWRSPRYRAGRHSGGLAPLCEPALGALSGRDGDRGCGAIGRSESPLGSRP
jgi:peptidoglycan/LPS O-acetylase OafA/YrhL